MGFELRTLCLLGKQCISWVPPPSPASFTLIVPQKPLHPVAYTFPPNTHWLKQQLRVWDPRIHPRTGSSVFFKTLTRTLPAVLRGCSFQECLWLLLAKSLGLLIALGHMWSSNSWSSKPSGWFWVMLMFENYWVRAVAPNPVHIQAFV
jgi:hypothetical protein